jgi:hypothetical protein
MASLAKGIPGTEMSVGVADFVINTITYMDRLPEVHGAAARHCCSSGMGTGRWVRGSSGKNQIAIRSMKLRQGYPPFYGEL